MNSLTSICCNVVVLVTADVQPYPFYVPPVEQFQNMHLVRPPMQPSWVPPQDLPNLQDDIRNQIEFYFR
jgi:la-related protein 1